MKFYVQVYLVNTDT